MPSKNDRKTKKAKGKAPNNIGYVIATALGAVIGGIATIASSRLLPKAGKKIKWPWSK